MANAVFASKGAGLGLKQIWKRHHKFVGVVDWEYKELAPTNIGKAARLLRKRKAVIYKRYPFHIRIKKVVKMEGRHEQD